MIYTVHDVHCTLEYFSDFFVPKMYATKQEVYLSKTL